MTQELTGWQWSIGGPSREESGPLAGLDDIRPMLEGLQLDEFLILDAPALTSRYVQAYLDTAGFSIECCDGASPAQSWRYDCHGRASAGAAAKVLAACVNAGGEALDVPGFNRVQFDWKRGY